MVIEVASVRLVISPLCPAVNVCAPERTAAVPVISGSEKVLLVLLFGTQL